MPVRGRECAVFHGVGGEFVQRERERLDHAGAQRHASWTVERDLLSHAIDRSVRGVFRVQHLIDGDLLARYVFGKQRLDVR